MRDLIDRANVIEQLKRKRPMDSDNPKEKYRFYQWLCDWNAMMGIPSVNEWISVKKRLPEKEGLYLCTLGYEEVDTLYYSASIGWYYIDDIEHIVINVNAWMYMPEPYTP